jgi:recombinational DNA repair protein RecR
LKHVENEATLRIDPDIQRCPHCDSACNRPRCQVCSKMLGNVRIIKRDD